MIIAESTKALELLNVKLDVWIDDEQYDKVYLSLELRASGKLAQKVDSPIKEATAGTRLNLKRVKSSLQDMLGGSNSIELTIKDVEAERKFTAKETKGWQSLFLAKRLRARVMENGSDGCMGLLDDMVLFLQKTVPNWFPRTDTERLLQHLYFQELSACARPGLDSLGYAVRALEVIRAGQRSGGSDVSHLTLYELWAELNQGIGYWHSKQRMDAALKFSKVIREFEAYEKRHDGLSGLPWWRRLLRDQAIIFRAELQEDLQFSYHTIKTLARLDGSREKHRFVKEALAYLDMRRLDEAYKKMTELFGTVVPQPDDKVGPSVSHVFELFENSTIKKGTGFWSKVVGLLFDYSLERLEDSLLNFKKNTNGSSVAASVESGLRSDAAALTQAFCRYKESLSQSKPDRISYFQQAARYLAWLAETSRELPGKLDRDIAVLYNKIKAEISALCNPSKKPAIRNLELSQFGKYEYNRFVQSMEKFFRSRNSKPGSALLQAEICFLNALNGHERKESYLYKFKELERDYRCDQLVRFLSGGEDQNCTDGDGSACFCNKDEEAFAGLLKCGKEFDHDRFKISKYIDKGFFPLLAPDYEQIMRLENQRFLDYLKFRSKHPPVEKRSTTTNAGPNSKQRASFHFLGLQRWNSQTPTLTLSQGGGYLLYEQDSHGQVKLGIAIDPGFDFVDNLFHMGFTLQDIDFILITHAHLDHIRDFEPIVSAMLDLQKRDKSADVKGKIHAIMTLGVYRKLETIISNTTLREFLADTYIVDLEREVVPGGESYLCPFRFKLDGRFVSTFDRNEIDLEIVPTKAYHDDYSERSDSFGYIINRYQGQNRVLSFGYTGDTKWHESMAHQYSCCDAICIHLGALIESENEGNGKNTFAYYRGAACEQLIQKKGHPYLFGVLRFVKTIKTTKNRNRLILLSEFGEELKGGIRIDLVHRLSEMLDDGVRCLPVDIGLNVRIGQLRTDSDVPDYLVWCAGCESFVEAAQIRFRHYGHGRDEGLYYFCSTCLKSKPSNMLADKMHAIAETGVRLEKSPMDEADVYGS